MTPSGNSRQPALAVHVVVMGVAGCGKSEVGRLIAQQLRLPLIEGDDFHPPANISKMEQGVPLTDADRTGWLEVLGRQMIEVAAGSGGAVLTCSALKKSYRDSLRRQVPGLRFVHLAITEAESLRRVSARPGHFYPPSLVASQFETLQDPAHEAGVLALRGDDVAQAELASLAVSWLTRTTA